MEGIKRIHVDVSSFSAGDNISDFYMVKLCELKLTTANKKYINMNLGDNTGEINAKIWDCNPADVDLYSMGKIVKVKGQVLEWQGSLQLKIERIRLANKSDNVDPKDFVPVAPHSSEDMYNYIYNTASAFRNKSLKDICISLLDENKEVLQFFPAAKRNHHAVMGGLLYHTSTMLRAAKALTQIYDYMDNELLYAGVILHDIGKIEEMDSNDLGMVSEYTTEGNLLGHIIGGIVTIQKTGDAVNADKETVMLLSHMILSHHYYPEYGSPKFPMIPEAELLHYLDVMDARMYDMRKATETLEPGNFSDRIWSLDNRQIYKGTK